ncbi:MAG: type II toxin-antitoxin system RelE/ParE family toxin [Terracidiphilus sp.]
MKRFEVRFLADAAADLDELFCHIAKESSLETADRYLNRLERFCLSLSTLPARGTVVPGRVSGLRRMGFERRATILFRVGKDKVEILRILYGGRDLTPVLEEILTR